MKTIKSKIISLPKTDINNDKRIPQNLYFLTDDKVKEGDWFLIELFLFNGKSTGYHLKQCKKIIDGVWINDIDSIIKNLDTRHIDHCKKIVATTDNNLKVRFPNGSEVRTLPQPSKEFIENYCKIGGRIYEVEIECDYVGSFHDNEGEMVIKVDSHNEIIIHIPKDSWSKEELKPKITELILSLTSTPSYISEETAEREASKWIEKSLK